MKMELSTVTIETEYDEPYAVKLFLQNSHYNERKAEGMSSFEELEEFIRSQKRFAKFLYGNNDRLFFALKMQPVR